jgi:Tfp pilus assembly protein PilF
MLRDTARSTRPPKPPRPWTAVVDLGGLGDTWPIVEAFQRLQASGKAGASVDLLRQALHRAPDLAEIRNDLAWLLVAGPRPLRNPAEAAEHARRAVELMPGESMYLNTYGVALYHAGRFTEAVPVLAKSLDSGRGEFDGFDLFFLAMAHHRLAHREEARACFERAVRWTAAQHLLPSSYAKELAQFRAEAGAILAGPTDELPDDVFAAAPPER